MDQSSQRLQSARYRSAYFQASVDGGMLRLWSGRGRIEVPRHMVQGAMPRKRMFIIGGADVVLLGNGMELGKVRSPMGPRTMASARKAAGWINQQVTGEAS